MKKIFYIIVLAFTGIFLFSCDSSKEEKNSEIDINAKTAELSNKYNISGDFYLSYTYKNSESIKKMDSVIVIGDKNYFIDLKEDVAPYAIDKPDWANTLTDFSSDMLFLISIVDSNNKYLDSKLISYEQCDEFDDASLFGGLNTFADINLYHEKESELGTRYYTEDGFNYGGNTSFTILNEKKINDAWYFENLKTSFGNNDDDSCAFVSACMLLSYYDTFYSDDFIVEKNIVNAIKNNSNLRSYIMTELREDYSNLSDERLAFLMNYCFYKKIIYNEDLTVCNDSPTSGEVLKQLLRYIYMDYSGSSSEPSGISIVSQKKVLDIYLTDYSGIVKEGHVLSDYLDIVTLTYFSDDTGTNISILCSEEEIKETAKDRININQPVLLAAWNYQILSDDVGDVVTGGHAVIGYGYASLKYQNQLTCDTFNIHAGYYETTRTGGTTSGYSTSYMWDASNSTEACFKGVSYIKFNSSFAKYKGNSNYIYNCNGEIFNIYPSDNSASSTKVYDEFEFNKISSLTLQPGETKIFQFEVTGYTFFPFIDNCIFNHIDGIKDEYVSLQKIPNNGKIHYISYTNDTYATQTYDIFGYSGNITFNSSIKLEARTIKLAHLISSKLFDSHYLIPLPSNMKLTLFNVDYKLIKYKDSYYYYYEYTAGDETPYALYENTTDSVAESFSEREAKIVDVFLNDTNLFYSNNYDSNTKTLCLSPNTTYTIDLSLVNPDYYTEYYFSEDITNKLSGIAKSISYNTDNTSVTFTTNSTINSNYSLLNIEEEYYDSDEGLTIYNTYDTIKVVIEENDDFNYYIYSEIDYFNDTTIKPNNTTELFCFANDNKTLYLHQIEGVEISYNGEILTYDSDGYCSIKPEESGLIIIKYTNKTTSNINCNIGLFSSF